jgi:hypothetical protein
MKSIYEITVPVTSQEQADRLKAICVKYGLPYDKDRYSFKFDSSNGNQFYYTDMNKFLILWNSDKTPITESEFLLLAKEFKQ